MIDHKARLRELAAIDGCKASLAAADHIDYLEKRLIKARLYEERLRRKLSKARHQRDRLRNAPAGYEHLTEETVEAIRPTTMMHEEMVGKTQYEVFQGASNATETN